jgi:L-2,4-diaminobutyric acid acetyltransferase
VKSENISPALSDFQSPSFGNSGRSLRFRPPTDRDGRPVHALISRCPPLDVNSCYANLLQCSHFSGTSILAETEDGGLAAFISGYLLQKDPDTLFIWQIAVDPVHRGQGIALSLLETLLDRTVPTGVRYLETTISPENGPSRNLFQKLFSQRKAPFSTRLLFDRETHFGGGHDDEVLFRGGPFLPSAQNT